MARAAASSAPPIAVAEGHRAERKRADDEARAAQGAELVQRHGVSFIAFDTELMLSDPELVNMFRNDHYGTGIAGRARAAQGGAAPVL